LRADDVSVSRQYPSRAQLRQRARDLKAGLSPVLPLAAVAQNISLDVRAGEHLAILGPNGAGKSTLALTLAGLLVPVQGQISATPELIGDLLSARKSATVPADIAGWRAADIATRIGLVFQEPEQQFIKATVRDELEFGPRHIAKVQKTPLDEAKLQTTVNNLLERLRLTQLQDANPFTLSGGEKRRLSVATALATAPKILMLDEPTFGQDANTWRELVLLIRELMDQGISVVSVTHDQDFVNALGGRTITLTPHHEEAA
ncbi:MAG: ABC transporter ATP-binding protein, partial [Rothia sp. (in: high G+C Gram-positive bacteria)]|nr:ABC transporter ATP-binding protein [Rothia sp. (in: high G+C Gram-positive bacteria)]